MQRDFMQLGGFGETLGNDVGLLNEIVPTAVRLLTLARRDSWLVIHTRESHLPDLSDCPISKLQRCRPLVRIGDQGPMGRILIRGEPGNALIDEAAPTVDETVIDKPGKGAFYATSMDAELRVREYSLFDFCGRYY
jgi:nicotinamidase-related amidase